jgi:hypothetical protein
MGYDISLRDYDRSLKGQTASLKAIEIL